MRLVRRLQPQELQWLRTRLDKRLPHGCCALFIASNVRGGVRSPLLAPLCAGPSAYRCLDQSTLRVREMAAWGALLREGGLDQGTLSLVLDQARRVAA